MENDLIWFGMAVGSICFMAGLCIGIVATCMADNYKKKREQDESKNS